MRSKKKKQREGEEKERGKINTEGDDCGEGEQNAGRDRRKKSVISSSCCVS